jgi:hypothetical protein
VWLIRAAVIDPVALKPGGPDARLGVGVGLGDGVAEAPLQPTSAAETRQAAMSPTLARTGAPRRPPSPTLLCRFIGEPPRTLVWRVTSVRKDGRRGRSESVPSARPAVHEEMRVFEFFRLWLLVVASAMAVAGTVMVLIATPVFSIIGRLFDRAFWPGGTDAATRRFQSWSYAVTFATMAGWGLSLAIIVANAFSSRQAWVWWSIAAGLALWFPLDTGRSLYHRVYANVVVNLAILVAVAIPLIATFGEFR